MQTVNTHSINPTHRRGVTIAVIAALLTAGAAHAQQGDQAGRGAAATAKASQGPQLQEIVVTAEKRATDVDRTPISISAVTGADLSSRGITDFKTLAAQTPGVSMKTMGQAGQTEFEMRGMTSNGGNSPTVGFYLDDTPLTAPAAAQNGKVVIDPTLYDLNRIEILRGPQGTLYGASSMGGTVKLVTNKPKLDRIEGSAEAILSDTDRGGFNHDENGMLNLPLIANKLALRVVGSQASTSGWIDRIVVGNFPPATTTTNLGDTRGNVLAAPVLSIYKRSNAENMHGGRAMLKWKPLVNFTITPMIFYQRIRQNGPSDYDSNPGVLAHFQPFNVAEPSTDSITINSLNINYRTQAFTVTSATSYWHRVSNLIQDNSENTPSCPGGFCVTTNSASYYGPGGTGPIFAREIDYSRQFSEEFRVASIAKEPWTWLVGSYYADFRSDWTLSENIPHPASFGSPTPIIFNLRQPDTISQEAIFGQVTYSPTHKLHLTGGARVYHYDSYLNMVFSGFGSPTGTATPILQHVVQRNTGANPMFDISYDINSHEMVYARVARGFRPGGGNQPLPSSGPSPIAPFMYSALVALGYKNGVAPSTYGPDHVWSYEIGEKARMLNNHLRINSSVYFENWKDIQLEEIPFGYPLFDNVNSAHIYGGEIDLQALATAHLALGCSVGYTHATLAQTTHGFFAGQRLPDVPEISGGAYVSYRHNIGDNYQFVSRLDNTYVGNRVGLGSEAGIINQTQAPLPSYDLVNFRFGINSVAGWSASLFIDNVTNKHAHLENVAEIGLTNAAYNRVATNQPRTIGVDLRYDY